MDRDRRNVSFQPPGAPERADTRPQAGQEHAARGSGTGDWQGALLIFFLAVCCLLPLFLVSLGAWLSTLGLGSSGSLWLLIAGVAIAALGLALWRRRRRRVCTPEGRSQTLRPPQIS
jgi:LPXTG-motif cell wall-anchored protein